MGSQSDLFAAPMPAGMTYAEELVTPPEEAALIDAIGSMTLTPFRFQGWLGKRLTTSFGWHYDFDDRRFAEADPIPDVLLPLRDKAAMMTGVDAQSFVHVLVTRYDAGAGIGWHRDRPVFDHVVGISLGAATTLRFRRRAGSGFERFSVPLAPRSAYHLTGDARDVWEHSIVPLAEARWSLTFRTLSARERRA